MEPMKCLRAVALVLLLLCCSHTASSQAIDSCSIDPNAYSCSLCLQQPGCVWCEQNGRCVSDNSTAAQTCVASQLITLRTPSKCPTCSNYMTCSDCMSARYGDCGWCAQNNSCISNAILSDGTACPASSYTSSKQGWPACPVSGFAEGLLSARDLTVFLPNDLGVVSLTNLQALDDSRVFRLQIPNSNRMLHLNIGGSAGRCHGEAYYAIITGDDETPFCIGLGIAVPSRDGSLRPVFNITAVNNEPYGPTPPRASDFGGKNQKGALIDMAPACGTAVSLFIACDTEVNDPALTMDLSELANVNPVCGAEFPLSRVLLKGKGGNGCHRYFFNSTNSQVSCTPAHLAVQRDDSTLITCYIFAMDSENREPWWVQDDLHYVGVNAYFNGVQLGGRNITSITLDENKKLFSFSFFANTADMGFYDIYVYMGRPTYDGNGTAPWKLVPGVINSDHTPFNGLPSPSFFVEIGDFPPPYIPSNSSSLPMWARGGIGAGAFILLSALFLVFILRDHVFLRKFMCIRLRRCCCCCRCCVKHLYRPNFNEITRPINEVYAFISLCGEDREDIAFPLMYVLEQCGIPTFLDRQFGMCGEDNVDAISNAMYSARFFIPIISDKLLACGRRWPFEEMYQAKQRSHQDYRIYPFVHGLSRKELDTGLKGSGMLRNHIGSVNKSMSPMDSVLKAVPHILAQIYNFEVTSGRNSLSRCPTLCSRRIASAAARWRLGLEEQTHADLGASPPNLVDVPRKPGYQLIPVAEEPQAEQVPLDRHPEYKITRFPVRPEIKNNVNDEDEKTEVEAASPRRTEINNTFQCFQRNHIREYRLLFRSEQKNLEAQDKDIPPVRTVVFKPSSDELMNWYKAAVAEAVCTRLDPTGRLRIDSLE